MSEEDGYLTICIPEYTLADLMKSAFSLDGQLDLTCRTCKAVTKHRHVSRKDKRIHSWIECQTCEMGNTTSISGEVSLVFLHKPHGMNPISIGYTSGIMMMVICDETGSHRKVKIEPENINEYLLNLMVIF